MSELVFFITDQGMFTKDEIEAKQRVAEMSSRETIHRPKRAPLTEYIREATPIPTNTNIQKEVPTVSTKLSQPENEITNRLASGEALMRDLHEASESYKLYPSGFPVSCQYAQMLIDKKRVAPQQPNVWRDPPHVNKPTPKVEALTPDAVMEMKAIQHQQHKPDYGYDPATGRYNNDAIQKARILGL